MFLKKQVFESVISSQASCRCVLNHNLKEKALNCLVLHQIILKIPRKLNMRISESLNDNLGWLVFYLSQNDLKPPTSLFIMFFSGILLIVLGLKPLECCGDSIFCQWLASKDAGHLALAFIGAFFVRVGEFEVEKESNYKRMTISCLNSVVKEAIGIFMLPNSL